MLCMPGNLTAKILIKGSPLAVNEMLWSLGMAFLTQCYSTYGLDVIAALNISNTIANVCNVVWMAMGNAIAIIVGQLLGAGKLKEARETDNRLIFFAVASCLVVGTLLAGLSFVFPDIYNTSTEIRRLAGKLILVEACFMPVRAFLHAAYFTLRSGGKTVITFLFDSVFLWAFSIPLAFVLSRFTGLEIMQTYVLCQCVDLLKCALGYILVKKGVWMENIVG